MGREKTRTELASLDDIAFIDGYFNRRQLFYTYGALLYGASEDVLGRALRFEPITEIDLDQFNQIVESVRRLHFLQKKLDNALSEAVNTVDLTLPEVMLIQGLFSTITGIDKD